MSGVVSGIAKTFAAVGSAAVRVGKAVAGVGASVFTAGAASGAGSMASGGLSGVVQSLTGGGVLGNVLSGALRTALPGALIGGAVGALTGQGFGKGALVGGLGGAVVGGMGGLYTAAGIPSTQSGLTPGETPTGMAPTGSTSSAPLDLATSAVDAGHSVTGGIATPEGGFAQVAAPAAPAATGGGFGKFLSSEAGGGLIAGLGKGYGSYMEAKQREESAEADRQFLRERDQRITDSYDVDPSALHSGTATDNSARPTPAKKYGRSRYVFDPAVGRVVFTQA